MSNANRNKLLQGRFSKSLGRLHVEIWQQWTEWLPPNRWNWRNFTLIEVAVEDTPYEEIELMLALCGLCLRLTWPRSKRDAA